jgi:hypothetical protein
VIKLNSGHQRGLLVTENCDNAEIWSPKRALGDRNPENRTKQVTKAQKMCFLLVIKQQYNRL